MTLQADLLSQLYTRLAILLLSMAPKPTRTLNPCFEIGDEALVMATQFMTAVPASILHMPVTNLQSQHDGIVAAIDFLLQGF